MNKKAMSEIVIVMMLLAVRLYGDISFSVTADQVNVTKNDMITITAEVASSKAIADPSPPSVPESEWFDVTGASTSQSQSTSIQVVNGKTVKTEEIKYLFYYTVSPKKNGKFEFPSLVFSHKGKQYRSKPFTINVSASSKQDAKGGGGDREVIVNISVDNNDLYAGEQAIMRVSVMKDPGAPVRLNEEAFKNLITDIEKSINRDFTVARLFNQITGTRRQVGKKVYQAFSFSFSITPIRSGSFNAGPVPFEYDYLKAVKNRSSDPFLDNFFGGSFFGRGTRAFKRKISSNSVSINVSPVPSAPSGFSGAVGDDFKISARVSPQKIEAGKSVTLHISVSGGVRPGNLADVKLPELDGFDVFAPEKHTYVDTSAQGLSSRKTYKYLLIPEHRGEKTIPPVKWTYFDPGSESFKTIKTAPLELIVTKGSGEREAPARRLTKKDIRRVGTDIRYIKTPDKINIYSEEPYRQPLFIALYVLPFLIAIFSLLYKIQSRRMEREGDKIARSRAAKTAYRRISKEQSAKLSDYKKYSKAVEILQSYISRKMGFSAAGKTMGELKEILMEKGVSGPDTDRIVSFIEELDSCRFGGHGGGKSAEGPDLFDRVKELIRSVEKGLKSSKGVKK